MQLPVWADKVFSAMIPDLRERGEGQELEFKEDFPQQAHDLAEEIAALATSGGGRILLGIANNGGLIGLSLGDAAARDTAVERAHGIINMVKPPVNASVILGSEEGKTILCIDVHKQMEPLYY